MDPVDRIIADNSPAKATHILVIDAPGLVVEATRRADAVSVWCDDIRDAELVAPELLIEHFDEALADVDLVWLRLPRSLGALDEYAELISRWCAEQVVMVCAERNKYLNLAMNPVLQAHFQDFHASRGQDKCRALVASGPRRSTITWPRHGIVEVGAQPFDLWWHGATFAAGRIDKGTRVLLEVFNQIPPATTVVDMGCGSGILSALAAHSWPGSTIHTLDVSAAAIDSTMRTCTGLDIVTHWSRSLDHLPAASVDIVVTNPPFHRGTAKDSTPAIGLFRQAARLLRDDGELWCVANSHLPWAAHLTRLAGPTIEITRESGYTVTRSVRVRHPR